MRSSVKVGRQLLRKRFRASFARIKAPWIDQGNTGLVPQ
jgi:hypothetical protein